jgi:CheY-like chemotaxis protein
VQSRAGHSEGLRRLHILFVEDDVAVRESVTGWLAGKGHAASWCSTGRQALEAMHAQPFDLLVLDMVLEGVMTGWDVAFIKQNDPKLRSIPFVIMTGIRTADVHLGAHTQEASVRAALMIVAKPLDFLALDKVLRAVERVEPVTQVHVRSVLPPREDLGS